ncbi:hypothetical protein L1987_87004 [Smallanthus sonchifolius]|uniref:Uncharacterized protein n=1 Tax=Smallanthus sonchifolius TaxID=185202 RepID=A0ACB8Y100_9ASTR|nr:hypothetical protein L1987_87004 [Smallanthus sonchifolius]
MFIDPTQLEGPKYGLDISSSPDSAQIRDEETEDVEIPDAKANTPLEATEGLRPAPKSLDSQTAYQLRKRPTTKRGSPYAKPASSGPIRAPGTRVGRNDRPSSRYSPSLADLRVSEFIRETAGISPLEVPLSMKIPHSAGMQSPVTMVSACNWGNQVCPGVGVIQDNTGRAPACNPLTNEGIRAPGKVCNRETPHALGGPVGGDTAEAEMNSELGKMMDFAYDSTSMDYTVPKQMEEGVCQAPLNHVVRDMVSPSPSAPAVPSGNPSDNTLRVDDDGFTLDRPARSKGGQAVCGLGGKQKVDAQPGSVSVPAPAAAKTKSSASGFNYARAVQGDKGSLIHHPVHPPKAAKVTCHAPLPSPQSLRIQIPDDLYPPDQVTVDGMDVDQTRFKSKANEFCQLNREHASGSRILPDSIVSPPMLVNSLSSLLGPGCSGKNYNISAAQKDYIDKCLKNEGSVSVDIVDQWCPGQWDYFNDLCTLMRLDPDNCIEDVDSDTENGTSRFLSGLLNSGAPKPPASIVSPNCVETSLPCGPVPSSDDGGGPRGHIEVQPASPNLEGSNQGSVPPLPRNGSSSRRFSPYGSNKGFGAERGKGKGVNRKEKGQKKYSPMLSELRVTEFVHETTVKGDRRKGGDIPATLGLNPYVEGATDDGITNLSPVDEATVMDTEMEGLKHTSCPANTQVTDNNYGMYSPRKDSNNTQSIIWDSKNGHYNISDRTQGNDSGSSDCDLNTQPDTHQMVNSVWNSPGSGLESFADKIKKSNELTGLKLEYFSPSISPDGGCRIHISQEDLKLSAQAYTLHLYGYFLGTSMDYRVQCKNKPRPMEEVESIHPSVPTPSPVLETIPGGLKAAPAMSKHNAMNVNEDGFVTVSRRKKVGPIKVQGRKQKPVKVKAATQQYEHVRPTSRHAPADLSEKQVGKAPQVNQIASKHDVLKPPTVVPNATKKGSTGFIFARAVQGDRGGKIQQPHSSKITIPPKTIDIDTANRFSVLDIPNSVKFNKLIEVQDDLYPPDQSLEDGMEVDMTQSKDGQIIVDKRSQISCEDQVVTPGPLPVCQPMGQRVTTAQSVREEKEEKDYGISKAQKMAITDRLCGPAQAVRAVDMDNWEQGEHEFFEDQVKALGLNYDYCIEDVESDDENGTAQFFAAQMKVGMPKVPNPTFSQSSK